jgi:hypothetical protein
LPLTCSLLGASLRVDVEITAERHGVGETVRAVDAVAKHEDVCGQYI